MEQRLRWLRTYSSKIHKRKHDAPQIFHVVPQNQWPHKTYRKNASIYECRACSAFCVIMCSLDNLKRGFIFSNAQVCISICVYKHCVTDTMCDMLRWMTFYHRVSCAQKYFCVLTECRICLVRIRFISILGWRVSMHAIRVFCVQSALCISYVYVCVCRSKF